MHIVGLRRGGKGVLIRALIRLAHGGPPVDENTFLTTVYCIVDDWYQQACKPHKPRRPGPAPTMSDSEVLTLAVLAQWHPTREETAVVAHAQRHWGDYFPCLLSQSAFNRRCRDLCGALAALAVAVGRRVAHRWGEQIHGALDAAPVPLLRRCRGQRHRLFADEAGIGHGGSDGDRYYGMHLLTGVTDTGAVTGFLLAPAGTDARWSTETWWQWQRDPAAPVPTPAALAPVLGTSHRAGGNRRGVTGGMAPTLGVGLPDESLWLADRGFAGAAWQQHWREAYGTTVLTRADYTALPPAARREWGAWFSGWRQIVECVHQSLTTLGLAFPRARSWWGVQTRIGAKVAAHNLLLLVNQWHHRPPFAAVHPFG